LATTVGLLHISASICNMAVLDDAVAMSNDNGLDSMQI